MASAAFLEVVPERLSAPELVGDSDAMREVRALIGMVAPTDATVLVTGPSGSGKELVARAIHDRSRRSARAFSAMNCGAVPADLLESELFGHERGAFTGAVAQVKGRFESTSGGTLFLDEIGDMPGVMQVKLLRVLEERTVTRVGSRNPIPIDTRIVSATHRDIDSAIRQQSFREDLFYRLAVFPIHLPSLAERIEDVPQLLAYFLDTLAPSARAFRPTGEAIAQMMQHHWPGNVRELRNFVERGCILHAGKTVGAAEVDALVHRGLPRRRIEQQALWEAISPPAPLDAAMPVAAPAPIDLPIAPASPAPLPLPLPPVHASEPVDLKSIVAEVEHDHIRRALDQANGVVADAARLLSLQRTTLIEKMNKYGLRKAG
ncbi:sigma-54-dependent Fis family transcriptional regulator [Sphingomonas gilva]|uniref:Sigma-54-dependent Fis family transcriptional regulator n=1 Tax=Sphingomonas gilva TaxID=2305907 RepID=A0A396RPY4_9SPHN|nr:sigma-54 dependent transcriptional regulator [Sphingomonas gilva]RHW18449.1 sigma-54-dependent Fis family transcriptional regulator [Sphingomonas gilva]